jgi:hypothetical protein
MDVSGAYAGGMDADNGLAGTRLVHDAAVDEHRGVAELVDDHCSHQTSPSPNVPRPAIWYESPRYDSVEQ